MEVCFVCEKTFASNFLIECPVANCCKGICWDCSSRRFECPNHCPDHHLPGTYRWDYKGCTNYVFVHAVEHWTCDNFKCENAAEYVRLWQNKTTAEPICRECLVKWLDPHEFTKIQTYN